MNDPVKATLDAARANAGASAPQTTQPYVPPVSAAPQAYVPGAGAVVQHAPQGGRLAISQMKSNSQNSLNVDNFLGVEKQGMVVRFANDDPRKAALGQIALNPLVVLIDYEKDVTPKYSIRINTPNGIKFFHSFDRVVMSDGVTPWADFVNKCKQGDPSCKGDYSSVDISGVLLQPAVTNTGVLVIQAGKRIGFSTSVMNWREYELFHAGLVQADLINEYDDNSMDGKVVVQIGHITKTNRTGIQYGAFTFQCLGNGAEVAVPEAPPGPAAAAPAAQPQPAAQPAATGHYVAPAAVQQAAGTVSNAQPGFTPHPAQPITDMAGAPAAVAGMTPPGAIPQAGGAEILAPAPKKRKPKTAAE